MGGGFRGGFRGGHAGFRGGHAGFRGGRAGHRGHAGYHGHAGRGGRTGHRGHAGYRARRGHGIHRVHGGHGRRAGARVVRHAERSLVVPAAAVVSQPVADPIAAEAEPGDVAQTRRYLKLKNETGEKLTVWLRYRTLTTDSGWKWFPEGGPTELCYELDPGEETYLSHEGWKINADRVRVWARTAGGELMDEFKAQDLWLVPEKDAAGNHVFYAPEAEDFTFVFSGEEPRAGE
jgi:hypothetical protein